MIDLRYVNYKLTALVMFFGISVFGQSDFIITLNGDTLSGKVTLISNEKLDRAQVVTTEKKMGFTALQVKEIHFENEYYHPAKLGDNIKLMKLLKGGYLSLYAYQVEKETTYAGRVLKKMDGSYIDVPTLTFRGALVNYIKDCESLAARVKNKELGRDDLAQIVTEYNQCINKATDIKFQQSNRQVALANKRSELLKFLRKVEQSDLENKKDIEEVINDMLSRVESDRTIPNYQIEALKEFLSGNAEFMKSLDELLAIL